MLQQTIQKENKADSYLIKTEAMENVCKLLKSPQLLCT